MTQIASEDYPNKLIYLHADTVTSGFDPALMQREHRARRRLEAGDERKFDPMVTFSGNEDVGGGNFTPKLTRLRQGVRIVPYDTGTGTTYDLDILNQIVDVADGLSDRGVFNRDTVDALVNIDSTYSPVQVVQVATGSGVTQQDKDDIVDQVFGRLVESGFTFEALIRLIASEAAGKIVEQSDGSYSIRDVNNTKDRITGEEDFNGGRNITGLDST